MRRIHGVTQHYDWGDTDAIPRLLGRPPDGRPWAEMWFGTHPGGAATLDDGAPLVTATGELPFLVKLLAAAAPLSLQTHPDGQQAAEGFARENAAGVPLDDARRIYRDANPKPELICALTEFEALCGLRDPAELRSWFDAQGWDHLAGLLGEGDLTAYLRTVLTRDDIELPPNLPDWASRLRDLHPDEPGGVAAALSLQHVVLQPGEALLLDAGNLHMYMRGLGVEVMSASDNVVRAAFTSKHVDVDELLRVADTRPLDHPVARPTQVAAGVWRYPTITPSFELTRCDVDGSLSLAPAVGPELLLCTDGAVEGLAAGEAAIAEAGEKIELTGHATVWLCRAPLFSDRVTGGTRPGGRGRRGGRGQTSGGPSGGDPTRRR